MAILKQRLILWWNSWTFKEAWETAVDFLNTYLITILTFKAISSIVFLLIWYIKTFTVSEYINVWEKRLYIWAAFIILFVIAFGVLRIYNAVVVNTQFLIRLKNEMAKHSSTMANATKTLVEVKASMRNQFSRLSQSISNTNSLIAILISKLK